MFEKNLHYTTFYFQFKFSDFNANANCMMHDAYFQLKLQLLDVSLVPGLVIAVARIKF